MSIQDAIDRIESTLGTWTTAEWTHEAAQCDHRMSDPCGADAGTCEECGDSCICTDDEQPWAPSHGCPIHDPPPSYCEGGDPENCPVCERAEADAREADEHARAAMGYLRDPATYTRAIEEINRACRIEAEYGDAVEWRPVREAVTAAITEAATGRRASRD